MKRQGIPWLMSFVALLALGMGTSGCADNRSAVAASPSAPTARLYDEFLESRKLAAELSAPRPDLDAMARERAIVENRKALRSLEAGVASKRALLADTQRDLPADTPNESLYFQIWSGHLGEGTAPAFRRLPGGGIEYDGRQFPRETAMRCAVPARLKEYPGKPFLACLTTLKP